MEPEEPGAWGWQGRQHTHRTEEGTATETTWQPRGNLVGWIDGAELYLEPEASYAAAQEMARDQGDGLPVSARTLHRRLRERGLLATWDGRRQRNTIRRTLAGVKDRNVLHLRADALSAGNEPSELSADGEALPQEVEEMEVAAGGVADGFAPQPSAADSGDRPPRTVRPEEPSAGVPAASGENGRACEGEKQAGGRCGRLRAGGGAGQRDEIEEGEL
jgi:hypothetical protein